MADVVASFRYYAGIGGTEAGRVVDTGNPDAISRIVYSPGRRLRADHALELPAAADVLEGRAGAARRQHLRPQAERAHALDRRPADARRSTRSACPPGVANLVLGAGAGRGRAADLATRGSTWSRSPAAWSPGVASWPRPRRHGEAGGARARRQEPERRLRGRRLRHGRRHGPDRGLPALRPGLLGRRAAGRRGEPARPVRRRPGRGRRADPARRPVRPAGRGRPADLGRAPREGRGVRRGRGGRGRGAALRRRAPGRPGAGRRLLLPADDPGRLRPEHVRACTRSRSARC